MDREGSADSVQALEGLKAALLAGGAKVGNIVGLDRHNANGLAEL
jgi:hypothetical protein